MSSSVVVVVVQKSTLLIIGVVVVCIVVHGGRRRRYRREYATLTLAVFIVDVVRGGTGRVGHEYERGWDVSRENRFQPRMYTTTGQHNFALLELWRQALHVYIVPSQTGHRLPNH